MLQSAQRQPFGAHGVQNGSKACWSSLSSSTALSLLRHSLFFDGTLSSSTVFFDGNLSSSTIFFDHPHVKRGTSTSPSLFSTRSGIVRAAMFWKCLMLCVVLPVCCRRRCLLLGWLAVGIYASLTPTMAILVNVTTGEVHKWPR